MRPFISFKMQWYGKMGNAARRGQPMPKPPEFFLRIMFAIAWLEYQKAMFWFRLRCPKFVPYTQLPRIEM